MAWKRKLNGWQRLWVVAAACSFIYAVGWSVVEGTAGGGVTEATLAGFDNPRCKPVVQMPAGTSLEPPPASEDPCSSIHFYRSIYDDAATTKEGYLAHVRSQHVTAILISLVIALAIWFVFVSLLYGAGVVVGWVGGGFRTAGDK